MPLALRNGGHTLNYLRHMRSPGGERGGGEGAAGCLLLVALASVAVGSCLSVRLRIVSSTLGQQAVVMLPCNYRSEFRVSGQAGFGI